MSLISINGHLGLLILIVIRDHFQILGGDDDLDRLSDDDDGGLKYLR